MRAASEFWPPLGLVCSPSRRCAIIDLPHKKSPHAIKAAGNVLTSREVWEKCFRRGIACRLTTLSWFGRECRRLNHCGATHAIAQGLNQLGGFDERNESRNFQRHPGRKAFIAF